MQNILLQPFPKSVCIDGETYPINSDFRIGIRFDELMNDANLSDDTKIARALSLYYPILPNNVNEAIAKMLWFFSCSKETKEKSNGKPSNRIYSFGYDSSRIYAAFQRFHCIDLNEIDYMHWWKFRNLMFDIGECDFATAIKCRSTKINPKMSSEEKTRLAEIKRLYAIPDKRTEKQKINAFARTLALQMNIEIPHERGDENG